MVKPLVLLGLVVMFGAGPGCGLTQASTSPGIQDAVAVWRTYVAALKDGDRAKAMSCWSERARRDATFDWQLPDFDEAVSLAREDSLVLGNVEETAEYARLPVSSYGMSHTYYAVHGPAGAVLANPVEVLTQGWLARETPSVVCHYAEGNEPTDDQVAALDEFCGQASARLGIHLQPDRRIDYYRCGSGGEVGDLFGMRPAVGLGYIRTAAVAAESWVSFHEIVHVLIGQNCREQPTSLLLEGAACWLGGVTVLTREAQLSWAKTLVENHEAMPLDSLVREEGFWSAEDMNDPYAEAAAFAAYLVATCGIEAFKALYVYRDSTPDLAPVLERLCGRSLGRIEADWHAWLLRQEPPAIRLDDGRGTRRVFRMEDPARDDVGDGDYSYPLAPGYEPGMFDLTGFEVRAGNGRVYFQLEYRHLVNRGGEADWGFSGTYTRIAIDAGGHGDADFGRDARATLAGHCDYRIEVSDCGVIVAQQNRITAVLKRVPRGAKLGDTRRNVVRFSIPCSEPEETVERWRYAVAVGGCAGRGARLRDGVGRFLNVGRNASEETGGGGSDDGGTPNLYDVLLLASEDQRDLLGRFDKADPGKLVILPMLGSSDSIEGRTR